jgi:hypothetical protein
MGLITGILGLPLAPVRGTIAIAEVVLQQAEEEYYDPTRIRALLDDVARARRDGDMSEEEAAAAEDALVERLLAGQQREGQHG